MLRHGQPLVAPGTCYGQSDVLADAAHTEQAAQAICAHWLAQGQAAPQEVWCSPLQRTRQMAAALRGQGVGTPVVFKPELAEMNFGSWEGKSWDEIGEQPLTRWTGDFWHHQAGGGESVAQLVARVAQAVQEARGRAAAFAASEQTANLLWVTHAGVIRAVDALLHLQDRFPLQAKEWPVQVAVPGGWQVFDLT